jgi:pimeloyl-ACP methyl ester carboxylesterase
VRSLFCVLLYTLSIVAIPARAASVREGDIDVGDGVSIHYVDAGQAGDASLLLIPGWSMSSAVWRDTIEQFASSTRVVAIDPRSQGDSTVAVKGNTPEQRAQDIRRVINALEMRNVVLLGWSQGVQDVAAYAAAFGGESISGYVLVDSQVGAGPDYWDDRPAELKQLLSGMVLYQQHQEAYLRGMLNAIIQSPEGRKRIDEFTRIGLRTPPDLGTGMLLMDFVAFDRRPALAKFDRPTLVIAATKSSELEAQRGMAGRIQGARFETIDDAGHAVFLDQPRRFHDLLSAFVRQVAPR